MDILTSTTDTTARARLLLRQVFGYDQFRGAQEAIIAHLTAGGDAFVLMPTGGGKSLCYQLPALLRPGVGVVVSPLIALMQDQVRALREVGVRAAFLNSTLSPDDAGKVEAQALAGALDLLYVSPERLLQERTLALLAEVPLALFAIDEAHCVSQWGHDFRAEYLQLAVLRRHFPGVPRLACTATADAATRDDILTRLELPDARVFVAGFDRPNIRYTIVHKQSPKAQLHAFLKDQHADDAGIVYCLSRKSTEETAAWLCGMGWNALPYHAGMDAATRQRHQDRFQREDGLIIVATIAFGMGIDKPDVRFVAHLDLPKSIESYYQETGRAGRDGQPADAWMAYGMSDVTQLRRFITESEADEAHKRVEHAKLNALLGLCETTRCRRQVLLEYFGEDGHEPCGNCDTCLTPAEPWDGTLAARKALYVVMQTGQRFGVTHLAAVLTGELTEKVTQFEHDRLSAFGRGAELRPREWFSVFRQLVAHGLLAVDMEHHGLYLTPAAQEVLRGQQTVQLRKDPVPERRKREKKRREEPALTTRPPLPSDAALWSALRALRTQLARDADVPPYVIFGDATLKGMLAARPQTPDELLDVSGVGQTKLARYGEAFLAVLREFGRE